MFPWWFPGFRQILVFPRVRDYCSNIYEWIINNVWFWWTLETSLTYCFPDVQQQPALLSHPMAPPSPSTNSSTNNSSSSSTAGWEQLSKTNLYIRGLSPSTTDHDLVKLCQPWVPPSCVVLYYLPLIIHWFISVCTGCNYWKTLWTKARGHLNMTLEYRAMKAPSAQFLSWCLCRGGLKLCSCWISRALTTFTHCALQHSATWLSNFTWCATSCPSCCAYTYS